MNEVRQYSESERNWAMLCHLSSFAGYIIPFFGGIIAPLIIWLSRRTGSEWIDINGKASLNFQISVLLYTVLCIPLMFLVVGIFFYIALVVIELICVIIASIRAAQGIEFRYPLSIPFIQ
ncbi:MAG: DUF4870 domain-containing protein [Bacteroidales bacterium]